MHDSMSKLWYLFSRKDFDKFGVICEACNCHGHSDTCHPETGKCINLAPKVNLTPKEMIDMLPKGDSNWVYEGYPGVIPEDPSDPKYKKLVQLFCHLRPELCANDESEETCQDNTTGDQCEECAEGFYGDATGASRGGAAPIEDCSR